MLGVFETAATARVRNSGSGSKCHCIPSSKLQHDGPAKSIGWLRTANTVCHQRRMRTWNRSMKAKQACVLTAKLQHLSDLAGPPPLSKTETLTSSKGCQYYLVKHVVGSFWFESFFMVLWRSWYFRRLRASRDASNVEQVTVGVRHVGYSAKFQECLSPISTRG